MKVTTHAIERYHQRVRPSLQSMRQVRIELETLVAQASHVQTVPWAPHMKPPGGFLSISDGVALVLSDNRGAAVTCVIRGDANEERKEAKRQYKRKRRRHRRYLKEDEKNSRQGHRKREAFRSEAKVS